jgi:hypothetical protein
MRSLFGVGLVALGALTLSPLAASATDLKPSHSHSVDLGSLHGIAYYTVEQDGGYRIVLTVAPDEAAAPVRFVTLLRPDQQVIMSVPGQLDGQDATIAIVRHGDDVTVSAPNDVTN